jgi:leucyl aminopeptidase
MEFHSVELKTWQECCESVAGNKAVAFLVSDEKRLSHAATQLDKKLDGLLTAAVNAPRFAGKAGQSSVVLLPQAAGFTHAFIIGLGKETDITHLAYEKAAGEAVKLANNAGVTAVTIVVDAGYGADLAEGQAEAHALYGAQLASYRFGKYFTKKEADELPSLTHVAVAGHAKAATPFLTHLQPLAESILFTRDIVSEPANIIHPESLAALCKDMHSLGLEVECLSEKQMHKLGMGALLGVGQGSVRESQLVILKWNGAKDKKAQPVAFVGKGVTFDTGGISIKPANGMEEMKWDMGGAATVIGVLRTLAARKAKVNAVGVVGLVENMPDGNAQRPGDVVTSYSGQTIEVLNTDAEGRLVLADALWYCQEQFKPQWMVDLATLTGAIIVSLGSKYAGLFSTSDELAERIVALGKETGDETWRLPLDEFYDKQINSDVADMQNIGADREAGSITAAQFLKRFTNDVPWAHLDIAGTAWRKKPTPTCPKGATGYGVRLLDALVAKHYEEK